MKSLWTIALACLLFAACSDTDDSYDGYANWKARNAVWFAQVLDSARTDIAAKGDNSAWRIRRTLLKTDASNGNDGDRTAAYAFWELNSLLVNLCKV